MTINSWQKVGFPEPSYINDCAGKGFELFLPLIPLEDLLSDSKSKIPVKDQVKDPRERILEFCETPKSKQEILAHIGLKVSKSSYIRHIRPLVEQGLLKMTVPYKRFNEAVFYPFFRKFPFFQVKNSSKHLNPCH